MRRDDEEREPELLSMADGQTRARKRCGEERAPVESPCPGCGAYYFALHEAGCTYEECPACGGALATCGCAG